MNEGICVDYFIVSFSWFLFHGMFCVSKYGFTGQNNQGKLNKFVKPHENSWIFTRHFTILVELLKISYIEQVIMRANRKL